MTCIKAQSMIVSFVDNKLSIEELEEFLDHVNSCKTCREELEVYYTLLTAMKQLNEDRNLSDNFSLELKEKLEKAQEKIIHAKYTYYRKKTMLILVMIFLAIFIGLSYANKSIEKENTVTESDFHIRSIFRDGRDDFMDLQLQLYLEQNRIEQLPVEEN